jgi:hypothetical protein
MTISFQKPTSALIQTPNQSIKQTTSTQMTNRKTNICNSTDILH